MISLFLFSSGNFEILIIPTILIGSCLGFIIFNSHLLNFSWVILVAFLGTILSILCLEITSDSTKDMFAAFLIPVMIMIIPIFDTTFVSINRYLRNIPLSTGGLDHSSHLLVKLGFSTKKTLLILYLISFHGLIFVITIYIIPGFG